MLKFSVVEGQHAVSEMLLVILYFFYLKKKPHAVDEVICIYTCI